MLHAPELRAFERTYRAEGPFVAAVLGRLAVPTEAVHDAVQDVFIAAYRRWPDYDDSRPVRPWLTAFAHRVAFRYRRSQARRDRKRAALRHVHAGVQRSSAPQSDARAFLGRFLGQLDDGHRKVFLLAELEGRTAPEVAAAVGISIEAVYGRVRSVRRRLHQALLDDAREPDARAASLVPPWSLLLPQLGSTAGASLGGLGLFAATVALGAAGMVGVAAYSPEVGPGSEPVPANAPVPEAHVAAAAPMPNGPVTVAPPVAPKAEPPSVVRDRATLPEVRPPAVEPSSLEAEAALLREAKRAQAAGRLEDALARLDTHAVRFPDGQLADGRRRARIRVLCDLGRTAQARGEAKLLVDRSPGDPLAVQALEICAPSIQSGREAEKTVMKP